MIVLLGLVALVAILSAAHVAYSGAGDQRTMGRYVIAIGLLLLATSCATNGPSTAPTASARTLLTPPEAHLVAGTGEQQGVVGSYCWSNGTANACAHAAGVVTPADAFPLSRSSRVTIRYQSPEPPDHVTISAARITMLEWLLSRSRERVRVWPDPRPGDWQPLEGDFGIPSGCHVVAVRATWPNGGSATYGFLVRALSRWPRNACGQAQQR